MTHKSYIPVIPNADIGKGLRFWVEGPGLTTEREMNSEDRLWLNLSAGTENMGKLSYSLLTVTIIHIVSDCYKVIGDASMKKYNYS